VFNNSNPPSGGGMMGGGTNPQQRNPRSMLRVGDDGNFTQLKCGGDNCCALHKSGSLYCWGANAEGSAGIGRITNMPVTTPTQVAPGSTFLKFFSVGAAHSCAIRTDGALLCWGRNRSGQLGQGSSRSPQATPVQVGTAKDWMRVAAGAEHTCGIRSGKTLWCWGGNDSSQLGVAREGPDSTPVIADSPTPVDTSTDWASIAAGAYHTCGIKVSRELRCWGRGDAGQVGVGIIDVQTSPVSVSPPDAWDELALGGAHSCGLDAEGHLYCWGENSQGQLGLGDIRSREEPSALP
jgi:alpha-tubulin suppressor-like RCC1 family protein